MARFEDGGRFFFSFDLLSTSEGAHNEDRDSGSPRHVIHVTYRRRLSIACSETERTTFRRTYRARSASVPIYKRSGIRY